MVFPIDLDVPPPLVSVDAQLTGATRVEVIWDPPSTSVTVTCVPSNCGTCTSPSPCTLSGLDSNTTYTITVTPMNNCGDGIASSVNVTTNFTGRFALVHYYRYVHIM